MCFKLRQHSGISIVDKERPFSYPAVVVVVAVAVAVVVFVAVVVVVVVAVVVVGDGLCCVFLLVVYLDYRIYYK